MNIVHMSEVDETELQAQLHEMALMELHDQSGKVCDVEALYFNDLLEDEHTPWLDLDTTVEPPHRRLYLVRGDDRIPVDVQDTTPLDHGVMRTRLKVAA